MRSLSGRPFLARACGALVCLFLLAAGCASVTDEAQTARRQIESVIAQGIAASRRGDVEAFVSRLPADFTVEQGNGRVSTREDVRQAHLNRARNKPETLSLTIDVERLQVKGGEATVWTHQRWERRVTAPGETRSHHIVTTQRHEEYWRRRAGRWEPYRIKELGGEVIVDGVRRPPGAGR